jgi:hypothetical protein
MTLSSPFVGPHSIFVPTFVSIYRHFENFYYNYPFGRMDNLDLYQIQWQVHALKCPAIDILDYNGSNNLVLDASVVQMLPYHFA